ncbi:hypothetical protein [Bdellovibrio svalbardensis]|uniref:Uncharacterized protein n=1 Tax=Bdellovibrio svalbardensis TaxID=2972972 RepID=A0ABT6DLI3_9BACT|nr:hypothetical protein [Bdellovibrio svalbardensis]MDG0817735.1 hypothetical protein [Bdellovibrio svalbardensis]
MSEDIVVKQPAPMAPSNKEGAKESSKESSRRSLFGNLNSELQQALNTWDVLTEQMAEKISPEEEQLKEVKRLLGELKSKLSEFSE